MNSIPNPFRKIKIALTVLFILVIALWFALHSQPVKHVVPDMVVMRRESITFEQALDLSLAYGDGRQVDWGQVI